jgi:raffinose/stachyose/melibiose transport system substrate-binding protein
MRAKSFRVLVALILITLVVGACVPAAAPASDGASPDKTTISFWYQPPAGGEAVSCLVTTAIDPFNEASDSLFIEAIAQPNAWDATRTAIAGGGGPDIVVTPGPSFAYELAQAGQLLALDDLAMSEGWAESFVPWALNLGKVGDKLYSLPHELETLVLFYNKTLFEANGWEPPTTMDELMALAETINAAGIIPFAHTNADWRPTNEHYVGEFLNHVAGPDKVYEALTGNRPWDDPDFVTAISMLNEMQANGWFMGGLDNYYTVPETEANAAFGNGEAAMRLTGTWFLGSIDDYFGEAAGNSNEWEVVPVPSTSGEEIFDIGIGSTWSINAASQHPEEAAQFLTYFFSPEVQGELLATCGAAPAPVRLEADALTGIDPRAARIFEALGESSDAGNYGYTTWTFWPPKSDVYIYEEIEKVWAGDMTTEEYLAGLQAQFAEELAAGDIPPIPER